MELAIFSNLGLDFCSFISRAHVDRFTLFFFCSVGNLASALLYICHGKGIRLTFYTHNPPMPHQVCSASA
jgi:hypothetical protein